MADSLLFQIQMCAHNSLLCAGGELRYNLFLILSQLSPHSFRVLARPLAGGLHLWLIAAPFGCGQIK